MGGGVLVRRAGPGRDTAGGAAGLPARCRARRCPHRPPPAPPGARVSGALPPGEGGPEPRRGALLPSPPGVVLVGPPPVLAGLLERWDPRGSAPGAGRGR